MNNLVNRLRYYFTRPMVIYIHPSIRTVARLKQLRALHLQNALNLYQDRIVAAISKRSPLFDLEFGFVGTSSDSLIQLG